MNKERVSSKIEIVVFLHPDCRKDEVFLEYISEKQVRSGIPQSWRSIWKTIRLGDRKIDTNRGLIYPIFVKKKEIIEAGLTPNFLKSQ